MTSMTAMAVDATAALHAFLQAPGHAAGVALVVLAWLLLRWLRARLHSSSLDLHRIPSPPAGDPFTGHVLPMARYLTNGHELFLRWHEQYGPIVRIRLLHRTVVLVADPLVAADVYGRGSSACPQRAAEYATFDLAHGHRGCSAILTHQDESQWKAIRKAIAPAFAPAAVRAHFPLIVDGYARLCGSISDRLRQQQQQQGGGGSAPLEVCLDDEAFAATLDVFGRAFLQLPREELFDTQATARAAGELVAITNTFVSQPWKALYARAPWLCAEAARFHRLRDHMAGVTAGIAGHLQRRGPPAESDSSLAACLLRVRDPRTGRPYSRDQLQAELFLEVVAQGSVPWTVAWALFCLVQHPEEEAAVLQELQGAGCALGDWRSTAAALQRDTLMALPRLTAVLHEAMRLYPAGVAASPRVAGRPTRVGPYLVPPGTMVFPCLYSILNYSGNWEQPLQFRPHRWLQPSTAAEEGAAPSDVRGCADDAAAPSVGAAASSPSSPYPAAFMPFGSGPKACIAQQLAYVECKVLLALLLSAFSWELAPRMGGPQQVLRRAVAALELRVEGGLWLRPTPRGVPGRRP